MPETALMQALADHVTGEATFTIPEFYWVTLANNGTEVTGVTRVGVLLETNIVDDEELVVQNATAAVVPTASAGTADEAWAMSASTSGSLYFRFPFDSPITLTAGGTKTFDVGALTDTWTDITATAP